MRGVMTTFKCMSREDWENAKDINHDSIYSEIDDVIRRWLDMKTFGKATDRQIAMMDAAFVVIYDLVSDADTLIGEPGRE
jgi:hypothetical protein